MKSLWSLRNGLSLLPLSKNDEDKTVQEHLVLTVKSSVFLSCDEGIGFISLLFQYPALVGPLHRAVKDSLPNCTRTQSAKFGDIYHRAWKKSKSGVDDPSEVNVSLFFFLF